MLKKRLIAFFCVMVMLAVIAIPASGTAAQEEKTIDNSALIPAYVPDSEVKLEGISPDWVKALIMAEVRLETATEEGTFQSATRVLDHYAEMGVNGLWITPIYDRNDNDGRQSKALCNGYGNYGPHTIWPGLTGTEDYEEGWKAAKSFVDEAHKRNIRIFFDIVTWGTAKNAPIYAEHPEWYNNGQEAYGGWVWAWGNSEWQEWFVEQTKNVILKTGADGFRCDLEPDNTGYRVFENVRQQLLEESGRKIAVFSEVANSRGDTYDFEQIGVGCDEDCEYHYNYFDDYFLTKYDIVDCVKTGQGIGSQLLQSIGEGGTMRFYTYCLASHDSHSTKIKGSRVRIGYQAIFAPFIPLWYIGEEWNNPQKMATGGTGVLFFNAIDWDQINEPENRAFYEDVKQMIRIRRQYPEIFNYYPDNHRETNICEIKVGSGAGLQCYARYAGDTGILILPNDTEEEAEFNVTVPLEEMGLSHFDTFTVSNLMDGEKMLTGEQKDVSALKMKVAADSIGVILIKGSKKDKPVSSLPLTPDSKPPVSSQTPASSAMEQNGTDSAPSTGDSLPAWGILLALTSAAALCLTCRRRFSYRMPDLSGDEK